MRVFPPLAITMTFMIPPRPRIYPKPWFVSRKRRATRKQTLLVCKFGARPAVQQAAGLSWADVGHRAPAGSYSNDLAIAGNYPSSLPVDDYMLVYKFPAVTVFADVPGQGVEW